MTAPTSQLVATLSFPASRMLFSAPLAAEMRRRIDVFIVEIGVRPRRRASRAVIPQALAACHTIGRDGFNRASAAPSARPSSDVATARRPGARRSGAKAMIGKHARLLARIEQRFGVQKELIVAIWTMEPTMAATWQAASCARWRRWRMIAGARIVRGADRGVQVVQRGHLPLKDMLGAYAARSGRRNSCLVLHQIRRRFRRQRPRRSRATPCRTCSPRPPNLLKVNGWQAGAPMTMGSQNFEVMREWNRSEVYRRTLVYFADQLR